MTVELPRLAYVLAMRFVILGGVIARVDSISRGLSISESWVANSVLASTWHGMFYYDNWLQTTPPLFLTLVRASVTLFGLSDYSLRAGPLAMGMVSLFLFAWLASRMLRPTFAVFSTALVTLSPIAVIMSKQLKQYSTEMAASCLIMLILWTYAERPNRANFERLVLISCVALGLSYSAVMFLPLVLLVLATASSPGAQHLSRGMRAARCAIFLLAAASFASMIFYVFVKPNISELLTIFWQGGFVPRHSFIELFRFVIGHFAAMGIYFYLPFAQGHYIFSPNEALKQLVHGAGPVAQLAGAAVGMALMMIVAKGIRRDRPLRMAAQFYFVPTLTLMALSWMRVYPVSSRRLTLFLLPSVALVTGATLQRLSEALIAHLVSRTAQERLAICALSTLAVVSLVVGLQARGWYVDKGDDAGHEEAFRFLKSQVRIGQDLVYVHAFVEEPARLYLKMLRWEDAPVRFGHTGYPCCRREAEKRPSGLGELEAYVEQDFDRVMNTGTERLWLVFTSLAQTRTSLDESAVISRRLEARGCREELEKHFENEVVKRYQCSGSTHEGNHGA